MARLGDAPPESGRTGRNHRLAGAPDARTPGRWETQLPGEGRTDVQYRAQAVQRVALKGRVVGFSAVESRTREQSWRVWKNDFRGLSATSCAASIQPEGGV